MFAGGLAFLSKGAALAKAGGGSSAALLKAAGAAAAGAAAAGNYMLDQAKKAGDYALAKPTQTASRA